MHHRVAETQRGGKPRSSHGWGAVECGRNAVLPGRKLSGRVEFVRFGPLKGVENRLGPPSPTFAHFDFSQANLETKVREMECRSIGVLRGRHERRRVRCAPGGQADFCRKKCGLFRESSDCYGWDSFFIRKAGNEESRKGISTAKHAKHAKRMARSIRKFGFPSPPRDGCPRGVVRWRETWSRMNANWEQTINHGWTLMDTNMGRHPRHASGQAPWAQPLCSRGIPFKLNSVGSDILVFFQA